MKVLVVGSGGREHALVWAIAKSPSVDGLICAPGNAGIAELCATADVAADDIGGLCELAKREAVDLVVVGPEAPLVLGLVDRLEAEGLRAFGPNRDAARLEGSKSFTKAFCARHGIPTAEAAMFEQYEFDKARAYVLAHELPVVIKADGLAAGKGVTVAESHAVALQALDECLAGHFGRAGSRVVVEAFLDGEEASLFALCDGKTALPLGTAQDHKRAFDGDAGPNTGGMGAYAPAPALSGEITDRVMREIVEPTLAGMAAEDTPFRGFLYAGLMLTASGPKLVEYNVRFGDPECQAVLPLLETDLAELLIAACEGTLGQEEIVWRPQHALTVVMASKGYPGAYAKGTPIHGVPTLAEEPNVLTFHAGTKRVGGQLEAHGGRVLAVTGLGDDLRQAADRAYARAAAIEWPEGYYRRDIGWRVLDT